eukprot:1159011-Pelagomonas_calceolata.AAC.1
MEDVPLPSQPPAQPVESYSFPPPPCPPPPAYYSMPPSVKAFEVKAVVSVWRDATASESNLHFTSWIQDTEGLPLPCAYCNVCPGALQ